MFRPFSIDWMAFSAIPEAPVSYLEVEEKDSYWMNVRFLPKWYDSMFIQWDIPDEWKGLDPTFSVFISESEGGPYHQISKDRIKDPFFIASYAECPSLTGNRDFFIIQTRLSNGVTVKSEPLAPEARLPRWQYKRWAEVIRREWILLDKFSGVDTIAFRRKDYGKRCPHCWDAVNEKIVVDYCPHCYGVSFEKGYAEGILTKVQYEISPDNRSLTYFGKFEQNQLAAWTIAYPTLKPHDILIRLSDHRAFRIEGLQNTEILTQHVRQMMQINELPKNAVEHELLKREYFVPAKKRPDHIHSVSVPIVETPVNAFEPNDIDIEEIVYDEFNTPTYEDLF